MGMMLWQFRGMPALKLKRKMKGRRSWLTVMTAATRREVEFRVLLRLVWEGEGRNTSLVSEASDPRQEQLRNLLILLPSLIGASYPLAA